MALQKPIFVGVINQLGNAFNRIIILAPTFLSDSVEKENDPHCDFVSETIVIGRF